MGGRVSKFLMYNKNLTEIFFLSSLIFFFFSREKEVLRLMFFISFSLSLSFFLGNTKEFDKYYYYSSPVLISSFLRL